MQRGGASANTGRRRGDGDVGPDGRVGWPGAHLGSIPIAALVGAVIVGVADLLARSLFAPIEIPCGVVTAAVGGPYLLYLLGRGRHG